MKNYISEKKVQPVAHSARWLDANAAYLGTERKEKTRWRRARAWLVMIYGGMSLRAMCRYSQFSECEAVDTAAGEVTGCNVISSTQTTTGWGHPVWRGGRIHPFNQL